MTLRIGLVSTLGTRVRPVGSGSIEGLVWLLARELDALGHEVTVFASIGSEVPGELVATLPSPYGAKGAPGDWQLCEWINLCRAVERSADFDVLHSHAYLFGLPLQRLARAPIVSTAHVLGDDDAARLWRMHPDACVTAISHHQWSEFPDRHPAAVIHHGVDSEAFTFRAEPDDYVCYLGRFLQAKGPLRAIAAARANGLRLLLAGPANDYYRAQVAPHVDGRTVEYVGPIGGATRDGLLGGARALLYPLADAEPFGLVMVEAMMCGTPVAGTRIGAVPEIVDENVTGCSAVADADFDDVVRRSLALDRRAIRDVAEARFSARRMAAQYVEVYEAVAAREPGTSTPGGVA